MGLEGRNGIRGKEWELVGRNGNQGAKEQRNLGTRSRQAKTRSHSVLTMSGPDRESMYSNSDGYEAFTTSTETRKTSKIDDYNTQALAPLPYDISGYISPGLLLNGGTGSEGNILKSLDRTLNKPRRVGV